MDTTGIIPELNYLLELVEQRFGHKVFSTYDFDALSEHISQETRELLSSSTLKRLYGYVSSKPIPRRSTLDILSHYIGKKDYDEFQQSIKSDQAFISNYFSTKTVCSSSLPVGTKLRIGWPPNRLVVLEHLGDCRFEVVESLNSKLLKGDRFTQVSFMMDIPLYISEIERGNEITPAYIAGMKSGLSIVELL